MAEEISLGEQIKIELEMDFLIEQMSSKTCDFCNYKDIGIGNNTIHYSHNLKFYVCYDCMIIDIV